MGGRGIGSATARTGAAQARGFTIDPNAGYQKISTGMAPNDALDMAADQIKDLDHEMSVLIAPDGTMYVSKGDGGSVRPPFQEAAQDMWFGDNLISLHNHPAGSDRTFGGPSSDSDWNVMIRKGLSESHISAIEGRYKMKITDPSKIDKAKAFFSKTKKSKYGFLVGKQSNYTKNSRKAFDSGDYESSTDGYLKANMDTLKKFGKRYGFELEFQPNPGWENLYK